MNRRNLSGIYIFHKFEDDDRTRPTCFEDCPEEKQNEWLDTLSDDSVKSLAKQLGKTIRDIGDRFEIAAK
jgi:hypothetical protein